MGAKKRKNMYNNPVPAEPIFLEKLKGLNDLTKLYLTIYFGSPSLSLTPHAWNQYKYFIALYVQKQKYPIVYVSTMHIE